MNISPLTAQLAAAQIAQRFADAERSRVPGARRPHGRHALGPDSTAPLVDNTDIGQSVEPVVYADGGTVELTYDPAKVVLLLETGAGQQSNALFATSSDLANLRDLARRALPAESRS